MGRGGNKIMMKAFLAKTIKPWEEDFSENRPIFSVEKVVIGDIFLYKNEFYISYHIINKKEFTVNKINFNKKGKIFKNEKYINCPYCGCENISQAGQKIRCMMCGLLFVYEREITVKYNSYPIKQEINIIEVK
jgi:hypothetical protein